MVWRRGVVLNRKQNKKNPQRERSRAQDCFQVTKSSYAERYGERRQEDEQRLREIPADWARNLISVLLNRGGDDKELPVDLTLRPAEEKSLQKVHNAVELIVWNPRNPERRPARKKKNLSAIQHRIKRRSGQVVAAKEL